MSDREAKSEFSHYADTSDSEVSQDVNYAAVRLNDLLKGKTIEGVTRNRGMFEITFTDKHFLLVPIEASIGLGMPKGQE